MCGRMLLAIVGVSFDGVVGSGLVRIGRFPPFCKNSSSETTNTHRNNYPFDHVSLLGLSRHASWQDIRRVEHTSYLPDGALSRNCRKFRRPFRRSTGKPLNALDQVSKCFFQVLRCGLERVIVSPAATLTIGWL